MLRHNEKVQKLCWDINAQNIKGVIKKPIPKVPIHGQVKLDHVHQLEDTNVYGERSEIAQYVWITLVFVRMALMAKIFIFS